MLRWTSCRANLCDTLDKVKEQQTDCTEMGRIRGRGKIYQGNTQFPLLACIHNMTSTYDLHNTYYSITTVCKHPTCSSPEHGSVIIYLCKAIVLITGTCIKI